MNLGRLARILGLCSVVVLGALSLIASNPTTTNTNPASATPTNPVVKVAAAAPSGGSVTVQPHVLLHYAALPLLSMQNGTQILFNAPSPTTLKVSVLDPAAGTSIQLPVITASENPPASTPTTGFARTDGYDTTQTPLQWMVTVRPPDSFYALGTFTISISVVSLDPTLTGAQHESPPLNLVLETFRIAVSISAGNGRVTSTPGGIACPSPGPCTYDFPPPPLPQLPAGVPPLPGVATSVVQLVPEIISLDGQTCFKFLGWSGSCAGSGVCTVTLTGTGLFSVAAAFDSGQSCATGPAICTAPQKSTPMCGPSSVNSSGIASCDAGGWYCCSQAAPTKDGSGCISGSGPVYGDVECAPGGGTPSNLGCQ